MRATVLLFTLGLFALCSVNAQQLITTRMVIKFDINAEASLDKKQAHLFENELTLHRGVKQIKPLIKSLPNARRTIPQRLQGIKLITCESIEDVKRLCNEFILYKNVIYAEPIYKEELLLIPNDPQAQPGANQDYLSVIDAYGAWDISKGDSNVIIGIIDTGIDLFHEDIESKLYINKSEIPNNGIDDDNNGYIDDHVGYDFADGDANPQAESSFHGNQVAGIAGASTDNGIGIAGIGYNSLLAPLKAFQTTSNLSGGNYEAILYAAENNYDVINLSWGSIGSFSQFNQDIINYAVLDRDVVVVAAAGNTPEELDFYPASYDHVLSVSATNLDDTKASFATYSHNVDLVAPGNQIYSTFQDDTYARDFGTSYSAPMVAGTAALIRAAYPELSALQVMELIRVNTDDIYNFGNNAAFFDKLGTGRLNAAMALNRENYKSLRVTEFEALGSINGFLFNDDTLSLRLELTNFLGDLDNATIEISSTSEYVDIFNNTIVLGTVTGNDQKVIMDKILYLSNTTPPGQKITLRIGSSDTNYADYQYFSFITQEDFLTNNQSDFQLTLSGNGNLGYATDGQLGGIGLRWRGKQLADNIGLSVSTNTQISDNWPVMQDGNLRNNDWISYNSIRLVDQTFSDFTTSSYFSDSLADVPLGILINQKSFSFDSTILQNGMILENRVFNISTDSVENVRFGFYIDWNINDPKKNLSYYLDSVLISSDLDQKIFTGLKYYKSNQTIANAVGQNDANEFASDIPDNYSDSLKIALTRTSTYDSAGFTEAGSDIINILSNQIEKIAPSSANKSILFIAAASSLDSLMLTLNALEIQYASIEQTPNLLSTLISCEGAELLITPEEGSTFNFYADPIGKTFIAKDNSLRVSQITSDTSIYFQKVINNFTENMQRIDIELNLEISEFDLSQDTLYLDDPTKNLVSFYDRSFEAISWFWDFDNGFTATIQNPTISFSTPGLYNISLKIENSLGCVDTEIKPLLVVQRPSSPVFESITICKGETAMLQSNMIDSLHLYSSEHDLIPILKGRSLAITDIISDTTFYISKIENGFESLKASVNISTSGVTADFSVVSDIENAQFTLRSTSNVDSISWIFSDFPNDIFSEQEYSFPYTTSPFEVTIQAIDSLGCIDSKTEILQFTPSPTPNITFNQPCFNESILITPENGQLFALYEVLPINGSNLIAIDNLFEINDINDTTTYFIIGLDNILPSDSVHFTIEPIVYQPEIEVTPRQLVLTESNQIRLSTADPNTISWSWIVNQTPFDIAPNPILFLDSAGMYEIILESTSSDGCYGTDTLIYEVIEKYPLRIVPVIQVKIFPNPVSTIINLVSATPMLQITVMSLAGQIVFSENINGDYIQKLDMSTYSNGIYIITIHGESFIERHEIRKLTK